MSKLHHSAENGDVQAVKQLIEHDEYDPQEKDKKHFDYTPLHHASRYVHKIISYFIPVQAWLFVFKVWYDHLFCS